MDTEVEAIRLLKQNGIPYVDPSVEIVCVSKLRQLGGTALAELQKPIVVTRPNSNEPMAVIIQYDAYLLMQKILFGLD
jgi:hypothetical protein